MTQQLIWSNWHLDQVCLSFCLIVNAIDTLGTVYGVSGLVSHVAECLSLQGLQDTIRHFLYNQLNPDAEIPGDRADLCACPVFHGKV